MTMNGTIPGLVELSRDRYTLNLAHRPALLHIHVMRLLPPITLLCFCTLLTAKAAGDVFVLKHGGEVRGDPVRTVGVRGQSTVTVNTDEGIRLTLSRQQVQQQINVRAAEREYHRRAAASGNSIADHWTLAEWCREQHLLHQRATHLRQILSLDPDHVPARRGLGFYRWQGKWTRNDEWRVDEGFVRFDGRWRTQQEIQLIEEQRRRERAEREWVARLARLHKQLETDRAALAAREIRSIRDPDAVRALSERLRVEPLRAAKLLCIEALAAIGNLAAVDALLDRSLNDPDEEVYHACVDELARLKSEPAVDRFIEGLRDANNVRVNRSAQALARMDAQQAVVPMIQALVTVHTVKPPSRMSPDAISTTFASPGPATARQIVPASGTRMRSGTAPAASRVLVQNHDVLAALVQLSGGVSFGFHKQAWENWATARRKTGAPVNLRDN